MTSGSIFICHSSKDKHFVEKMAQDLVDFGIDVWYDKWEIKVGDSIIDKVNSGIIKSSYMGVVLSPNSIKSRWVKKELNTGLIKEIKRKKVIVLPILYKPSQIPPLLSDKKYADFTKGYQYGLSELLDVFNLKLKQKGEKSKTKGHLYVDNILNNVIENNFIDNVFESND